MIKSDQLDGWPHPKDCAELLGQRVAWNAVEQARESGRMPHCWLLTGSKGIGKATLAYKMAQLIQPDHTHVRVVKRGLDDKGVKLKSAISIDDIRALKQSFEMRAVDNQWRVCIVDTMDDLTLNAANALLKLIEEPPAHCVFILLAHQPGQLLPTIRSRCRVLPLEPLPAEAILSFLVKHDIDPVIAQTAAVLSDGSLGLAIQYTDARFFDSFCKIRDIFRDLPAMDTAKVMDLAEGLNKDNDMALQGIAHGVSALLARLARTVALQQMATPPLPDEPDWLSTWPAHTAPAWAGQVAQTKEVFQRADALHLDPQRTILTAFLTLKDTAETLSNLRKDTRHAC